MNRDGMVGADPQEKVRCAPLPDWVEHQPYESQTPEAGAPCMANGICQLLIDTQADLSGPEFAWHCRIAMRVLTRAGAERASHFVTEFDPAYRHVEVHFIRIVRGDEVIEHANPGATQTFRRETSLERLVLNGRLTASLLIPDVRVGDLVEFAFTHYGSNPALHGKYAAWTAFDCFNPALDSRHRLVRPTAREIFVKRFNDPTKHEIVEKNGIEEWRWRLVGQKRCEAEELTPPWLILTPTLQFSEFHDWNEVARLFAPLYESSAIPDALGGEIDQLAAAHADPADRAAEWLRFVQQTLRYFALTLGEGGLVPRDLEAIWGSRLGDCKDAARLYLAGARRMGLDACAALISTVPGMVLHEFLPSPDVFNHCIVRLRLNGRSYWLDPTTERQSGSLENICQLHAGWALALAPEAAGLEQLETEEPVHVLNLEDELHFGPKREAPAALHRHVEHFSWSADFMRSHIANQGATEYARKALAELRMIWPGIIETAPIEIRDDPVKNRFTLVLCYEIPHAWKQATRGAPLKFEIANPVFAQELSQLRNKQRRTAIYLGRPRKLTRRLRLHMSRAWAGDGWQYNVEAPGVSYHSRLDFKGSIICDSRELLIEAWSVPPEHASSYSEVPNRLGENLLFIWARERFGKIRPLAGGWGLNTTTIWIVVVALWALAMSLLPILTAISR